MLLIGLDRAAPGNAVAFHFDCEIDGVGVDPTDPPLRMGGVERRRVGDSASSSKDETGGLNRKGDIVLHLPLTGTRESLIEGDAGRMGAGAGDRGRTRASRRTARHR